MKICPKCGVSQKDSNNVCVDCGTRLGAPVDEKTAADITKRNSEKLESLNDSCGGTSFGKRRVVLLVVNAVISIISGTVLWLCFYGTLNDKFAKTSVLSLLCGVCAVVLIIFPRTFGTHFREGMNNPLESTDNLTPSYFYYERYRVNVYLLTVFAVLSLLMLAAEFVTGTFHADIW